MNPLTIRRSMPVRPPRQRWHTALHVAWWSALASLLTLRTACADQIDLAVSHGAVSLPIYVAESRGYFRREGVSVRLIECASGRSCFDMLSSGRAKVATAAELVMPLYGFRHPHAAIIATLSASTQHIKLVARRAAGIQAPGDLRGRRVGTIVGTSAQYFLDNWLVFEGIAPREVEVRSFPPAQLAGALQRREVDAIAAWEPIAADAITALAGDAIVLQGARAYTQHFTLIASGSAIAEHRPDLVRLLRALALAEAFIAAEPQQAAQIGTAKGIGVPNLAEHRFELALDQSLLTTMEAQVRWAVREGLVPPDPPVVNLLQSIEPALLREVAPQSVRLIK